MTKYFYAFVIAAAMLLSSAASVASANTRWRDPGDGTFPLDLALPFPWGTIEGLWETTDTPERMLFSFEVKSDCGGHKVLKVVQIDTDSGEIVAEGTGIAARDDKQVSAGMKGPYKNTFMVHVGAYQDNTPLTGPETYTLLTIRRSFTIPDDPGISVKLRLISRRPINTSDQPSSGR